MLYSGIITGKMNKMMTVIIAEGYRCVGTCVTSFDDDGTCNVPELPWATKSDFEIADQQAEHLDIEEFYANVHPDPHVEEELDGHEVKYLHVDGVFMLYDDDTYRYYFFA